MTLNWHENFDALENSIWTAVGPWREGFEWRLCQRLFDNCSQWYASHDHELGGETGETWQSLDEAKAAIQEQHDRLLADVRRSKQADRRAGALPIEILCGAGVRWHGGVLRRVRGTD